MHVAESEHRRRCAIPAGIAHPITSRRVQACSASALDFPSTSSLIRPVYLSLSQLDTDVLTGFPARFFACKITVSNAATAAATTTASANTAADAAVCEREIRSSQ